LVASFAEANLRGAQFVLAVAAKTSFAAADLSYCILLEADVADANTDGTNLHGVVDENVAWTDEQLAAAKLTDEDLYASDT